MSDVGFELVTMLISPCSTDAGAFVHSSLAPTG